MFRRNTVRKHIRFYGEVQAVGFRYTAYHAAQLFGATGWVRNEYDGSVTMEIQGSERQIDDVVEAIQRGTYIRIDSMDVKTIQTIPDERGFRVAY
ncbi:MAG: acylphosphatase [Ruminococcus sp.]|nr:acylphosphatase [Ruminococcus sp.]